MIATNLHEDSAELTEGTSHLCLETAILDALGEASVCASQ